MFLAGLGWLTASSRLPAVALGNLLRGFAMLALSWRLAAPPRDGDAAQQGAGRWVLLALACSVIQVAVGELVSASYASLSCADPLECLRMAAAQGWPWPTLSPWREPVFDAVTTTPPVNPAGALAQALHRAGAQTTSLAVVLAARQLGRRQRRGTARRPRWWVCWCCKAPSAGGWWRAASRRAAARPARRADLHRAGARSLSLQRRHSWRAARRAARTTSIAGHQPRGPADA